ncbi:MAG: tRNA adenosine(34) deaminase TadA [Bacillota bacterium]
MDEHFMRVALEEAGKAYTAGEVPVGAVLVNGGEIVARGHNLREATGDPTAHAEIVVLRQAASLQNHWRLADLTMYVTIEPCPMCAGALVSARIKRLVYGADDPKAGAIRTLYSIVSDPRLNHRLEVASGVMSEECAELIRRFFREKR